MDKVNGLFAYGTLRRGFQRHSVLTRYGARFEGFGTIRAALYDLGSYPGVVENETSRVTGEVYIWDNDSGGLLSKLDEVEGYSPQDPAGSLFVRRIMEVDCEGGVIRLCWVYFYNRSLDFAHMIPSGDYSQRCNK